MATTVWGLCFSYGRQLYCDESRGAWRPLCLRKSTSHPMLLQAAPLKSALVQMRRHVPGSRAGPSSCVNETACTPLCTRLSWTGTSKIYWVNVQITNKQTSLQGLQPYNTLGGAHSDSPQLKTVQRPFC